MLTNTLKYFSRVSSSTRLLARNAKFASTSIHHLLNNKNAALITNLPPEITQSALLEKLKDIAKKDVYLQPGCSIHYLDKSKAIVSAEYLSSKGLKTSVRPISMPTVVFQNLPDSVNSEKLSEVLSTYAPHAVNISIAPQKLLLRFEGSSAKLPQLQDLFDLKGHESISFSQPKPLKKHTVLIRNIGHMGEEQFDELSGKNFKINKAVLAKTSPDGFADSLRVFVPTREAAFALISAYHNKSIGGKKLALSYREFAEHCLVVNNLPLDVDERLIHQLCEDFADIAVYLERGKTSTTATISVSSEEDQEVLLDVLNKSKLHDGSPLRAIPSEIYDFGVEVKVSAKSDVDLIRSIAKRPVAEADFLSGREGVATFLTIDKARRALSAYQRSEINFGSSGQSPLVFLSSVESYVLEIDGLDSSKSVVSVLDDLANFEKDLTKEILKTSRQALVRFPRARHVVSGIKDLKKVALDGNNRLKVERFRPFLGVSSQYDNEGRLEAFSDFSSNAFLKDDLMSDPASRYRWLKNEFDRRLFDAKPVSLSEFEKEVKNENEEATDFKNNLLTMFIDSSMPAESRLEAESLIATIAANKDDEDARARLFTLFVQQQDFLKFSKDFRLLEAAAHGSTNADDVFRWNTFSLESEEDYHKMNEVANDILHPRFSKSVGGVEDYALSNDEQVEESSNISSGEIEDESFGFDDEESEETEELDGLTPVEKARTKRQEGEEYRIPLKSNENLSDEIDEIDLLKSELDEEEDKEPTNSDDMVQLVDNDGRVWSGYILGQDVVQTTTAGGRIQSFRALVAVGNLRGTAGFGTGKADKGIAAVNKAFRSALRNLVHIDLYENAGLAHDLVGKHNSCKAYITATPPTRAMIASPFAENVLNLFGIGSASVKFVGRRDPYAKVRAIFDALSKHQNIDEYSKARGKRYLSEKWLRDQRVQIV